MSYAIQVNNLTKQYVSGRVSQEEKLALNDLNIEVGSIFGLLGPN